ncbi:hypothetical protein XENTR_v10004606 [Xenopus tropicalis]|nr:hypothetical protein XENTR_v10004606 [Xenopus tropicalis]
MAAPAGRALRQVLLLRTISGTPIRAKSGGEGPPQHRASKTLVSFPVKFPAAPQEPVTGEGRSGVPSRLPPPAVLAALQELGAPGPVEHVPAGSLGPQEGPRAGAGGPQAKGPEEDEDSSSSSSDSSSDSEDEGGTGARGGAKAQPKESHPDLDLLTQDEWAPPTVPPETQARGGISGGKTEQLMDPAPVLPSEGLAQGKGTETSAELDPLAAAPGSEGAKMEELMDPAPVLPSEGLAQGKETETSAELDPLAAAPGSEGAKMEELMDPAPVLPSEGLAQGKETETSAELDPLAAAPGSEGAKMEELMDPAPVLPSEGLAQGKEKLGGPVGDVPVPEAPEDTKPSGDTSPANGSPAPPAEEVGETDSGGAEEAAPGSSAAPPPVAPVPPPAAPVMEAPPFDNSKYQNLQHYGYTPYTFVDSDLELSKVRLPQPSSGRPSPRH